MTIEIIKPSYGNGAFSNQIKYPKYNLKDIIIKESLQWNNNNDYDFKILKWNNGSDFAKVSLKSDLTNHSEKMYIYIKVNNANLKDTVYNALLKFKPEILQPIIDEGLFLNAPSFQCHELYAYVSKKIPELS